MRPSRSVQPLVLAAIAATALALLGVACVETPSVPVIDDPDASRADGGKDGRADDDDDDLPGKVDGGEPDADADVVEDGPGKDGDACGFNHDCEAALRCECDEDTGCACKPGERGTGKNGVDTCVTGEDCASSVCVEGPDPGESICSDSCTNDGNCTGKLPRCLPIAGLPEPICVRDP